MRFYSFVAAAALASASLAAHADTISTFSLTDVTLQKGSAAGSVTINTTTGEVTGASFTATIGGASDLFNMLAASGSTSSDTAFDFRDSAGDVFQLSVPNTTLVGYTGSLLCTYSAPCGGYVGGFFPGGVISNSNGDFTTSGALTLTPVSATPEPSSLALLGTGLLGAVGMMRKRLA